MLALDDRPHSKDVAFRHSQALVYDQQIRHAVVDRFFDGLPVRRQEIHGPIEAWEPVGKQNARATTPNNTRVTSRHDVRVFGSHNTRVLGHMLSSDLYSPW